MAEKRVSVRLAAVGGRQVRAELQGIGEAGEKGFRQLSREMDAANARVAAFYRRVQIAAAAAAAEAEAEAKRLAEEQAAQEAAAMEEAEASIEADQAAETDAPAEDVAPEGDKSDES